MIIVRAEFNLDIEHHSIVITKIRPIVEVCQYTY